MRCELVSMGITSVLLILGIVIPNDAVADPPPPLIGNGGFEDDSEMRWEERHATDPPRVQKPVRTEGNGYEETKCLTMGKLFINGPQGANPSIVEQGFDCGDGGAFCSVTFNAVFHQRDLGEIATVGIVVGGTHNSYAIPPSARWETYTISVAGCSEVSIIDFTLYEEDRGFCSPGLLESQLRIDNVVANCTPEEQPSTLGTGHAPEEYPQDKQLLVALEDCGTSCRRLMSPTAQYLCETEPICAIIFEGKCVWDPYQSCACETIGLGDVRFGLQEDLRHGMKRLRADAIEGTLIEVWEAHSDDNEIMLIDLLGSGTADPDNQVIIDLIEPLDCGMELALLDMEHHATITSVFVGWPPAQLPSVVEFVEVLLGLNPNPPDIAACDFNDDGLVDGVDIEGYLFLTLAS